jgi:hypothetical protein
VSQLDDTPLHVVLEIPVLTHAVDLFALIGSEADGCLKAVGSEDGTVFPRGFAEEPGIEILLKKDLPISGKGQVISVKGTAKTVVFNKRCPLSESTVTFSAGTGPSAHVSSGIFPKGTAQMRIPRPHASARTVSRPKVTVSELPVVCTMIVLLFFS